jgi:hydrogenase/urease accessory protein HupE
MNLFLEKVDRLKRGSRRAQEQGSLWSVVRSMWWVVCRFPLILVNLIFATNRSDSTPFTLYPSPYTATAESRSTTNLLFSLPPLRSLFITLIITTLTFLPSPPAHAHALQPAYLNIIQRSGNQYEVSWKVPFAGESSVVPLSEEPELPDYCEEVTTRAGYQTTAAMLTRWTVNCGEDGLYGATVHIKGLESALNDVLFRLETADGETYSSVLRAATPSYAVPARGTRPEIAWSYLTLGIGHILSGYDHLLFVLGLVLIVKNRFLLFKTITAFTVAHSITLGAATLGFVNVSQTPTEAVIALSILFLAGELAHGRRGKPGLTERYPWLVALTFGLLHGLGFAGALTSVGLPQSDIPLALLLFNLGVEIGQLMFVFSVLAIMALLKRLRSQWPDWSGWLAPYAIGSLSAFWMIDRIAGFWEVG